MLRSAITRPVPLPVFAALGLSLLVHILLLGYLVRFPDLKRPVSDSSTVSVELLAPQPAEPESAQPEPVDSEPPAIAEAPLPEPASAPDNTPEPLVAIEPSAAEEQTDPAPATRLNLSRPSNWDDLAIEPLERREGNWFKRSDTQALAERRTQQAASQALTNAQRARLGIPAEEYRTRTDAGELVKTDKGCFIKRTEHGLNGMQERWWRTGCKDGKVPSWRRKVLSFGPDHRILPDDVKEP